MEKKTVLSGYAIAVVDRGFVYVGRAEVNGEWCVMTDARNIRRWGTTKGLGELALQGPQENTVLDPVGAVRIPLRALVHLLDTEAALWSAKS